MSNHYVSHLNHWTQQEALKIFKQVALDHELHRWEDGAIHRLNRMKTAKSWVENTKKRRSGEDENLDYASISYFLFAPVNTKAQLSFLILTRKEREKLHF